jgi:hypothetical protein
MAVADFDCVACYVLGYVCWGLVDACDNMSMMLH